MRKKSITSPYAPDVEEVRAWLEKMIARLEFVKLVTAILSLIMRMHDLNTELTKRVAHLTRKRPRSESLERVERQLALAVRTAGRPRRARAGQEETDPGVR